MGFASNGAKYLHENSPTFKVRIQNATKVVHAKYGPESDPKEILSRHAGNERTFESHSLKWKVFLLAYPSAALAMMNIHEHFRALERNYPAYTVEFDEDGDAYDVQAPESDTDADSNPMDYFLRRVKQDIYRNDFTEKLLDGDITSRKWYSSFRILQTYSGESQKGSELKSKLEEAMEMVSKPYHQDLTKAINEISRRFNALKERLDQFTSLASAHQEEFPPRRQKGQIVDDSDTESSTTPNIPELPGDTSTETQSLLIATSEAQSVAVESHADGLRRRGLRKPRLFPETTYSASTSGEAASRAQTSQVLSPFTKRSGSGTRTSVSVILLSVLSGIFTTVASMRLNDTTNSTKATGPSSRLDTNFYTNLSNLVFTLASVLLLLRRSKDTARKPANSKSFSLSCSFVMLAASLVAVIVYPFSVSVSLWAGYLVGLAQLVLTWVLSVA